jgi:hypothetical protein
VGSNSTQDMDVCVCSVFVSSCVDSGLASGWSPVQGVLPTVYNIHNFRINSEWEQAKEPYQSRHNSIQFNSLLFMCRVNS